MALQFQPPDWLIKAYMERPDSLDKGNQMLQTIGNSADEYEKRKQLQQILALKQAENDRQNKELAMKGRTQFYDYGDTSALTPQEQTALSPVQGPKIPYDVQQQQTGTEGPLPQSATELMSKYDPNNPADVHGQWLRNFQENFPQGIKGQAMTYDTVIGPDGKQTVIQRPVKGKTIIEKPGNPYMGGAKPQLRLNQFTGENEWYIPPTVGGVSPDGQPAPTGTGLPNGLPSTAPDGSPLTFRDKAKIARERPKAQGSLTDTLREYDNMINEANSIKNDPSLDYATGIASPLGMIPGTGPKRVASRLETLKAKTLLNTLSQLKSLSANGSSGFGQLSNIEGEQIRNSVSSLDPHQSPSDFRASIDRFTKEMQARKQTLQNTFNDTYGGSSDSGSQVGPHGPSVTQNGHVYNWNAQKGTYE